MVPFECESGVDFVLGANYVKNRDYTGVLVAPLIVILEIYCPRSLSTKKKINVNCLIYD